jgi:hypothetical protein
VKFIKGKPHECFSNTLNVCANDRKLTYCEGIAGPGSSHHAWAQTAEGEIVECTWPRAFSVRNSHAPYRLAKAFTRDEVQEAITENIAVRHIIAPLLTRDEAWERAGLETEWVSGSAPFTRMIA